MKIVIIHQHFRTPNVGGALRSYYLATGLQKHGHQVSVVTSHNDHQKSILQIDGVRVHYLPVSYDNHLSFLGRIRSYLLFAIKASFYSHRFKDSDLCYAISTPLTVALVAWHMKWWYKTRYVFETGDLWPEAPIQLGIIKNTIVKSLLKGLEKYAYRKAEALVAVSESMALILKSKCPGKAVYVIPNMADVDSFQSEPKNPLLEEKYNVKGQFVIAFFGTMGFSNDLDALLSLASAAQDKNLPVTVIFKGDGADRARLAQRVKSEELQNVLFLPFTSQNEMLEVMNITDAYYISFVDVPILSTGAPNKLFDGLAAGKLIIVNYQGWIREIVEQWHCGIYHERSNPEKTVEELAQFLNSAAELAVAKQNSRKLAEEVFARDKVVAEFEQAINRLAAT